MYQWFRTSFRANHTPIFVRVVSDSDAAYIANWKTWQSELCLKGTKELGSRSQGFCQWSGKFSLWKEKLTCDQVSQELIVKSSLVWGISRGSQVCPSALVFPPRRMAEFPPQKMGEEKLQVYSVE